MSSSTRVPAQSKDDTMLGTSGLSSTDCSDAKQIGSCLESIFQQSRVFSNAVLSDSELVSACDAEIKDLLQSRQEIERRLQNVESIAHRMRANLSAHKLVITGLGIKKDMVRVRKKKRKMSQSRKKARIGPRDSDQEEIFATGGCSLQ